SYPFCSQKCTYCNFASGVLPKSLETAYVEALVREMGGSDWPWRPETVYLGGGTPSNMAPHDLERILAAIPGRPWREATIEAAPGGIGEHAEAWIASGITRVSLGVQSFVQRELSRTGRKHTAAIVADEIALLRAAGLDNINVDLIAGLPGQTRESWMESLGWIEKLAPPHVSVYMLEVDEDSRLGNEILLNGKRYGAPEVPADGLIAELYETAVRELARMGIERYEISNFARPGFESLHNLKYWRLEPYLGFGADAHSFDGRSRWQNVESAQEYVDRVSAARSACLESVAARQDEERFFVGLRLSEGLQLRTDDETRFEIPIRRFVAEGLLALNGRNLRLTDRGVLFSNEVFAEFIGS
ncbi:MAG TPA: radical SAM family heme chaperone HemW, partial [Bryobacteraceae bacterium]|nr:radical SAM family heme chaperone HemW [Bryobacteraceae bacterium]